MSSLISPAVIVGIALYFGSILGSLLFARRIQADHPKMSKATPIVGSFCGIAMLAVLIGVLQR